MQLTKLNFGRMAKFIPTIFMLVLVFWIAGSSSIYDTALNLIMFPASSFAIILVLLVGNLWLVGFRFWLVLKNFSIHVSLADASRASIAGHAAGLVLISLIGQVTGRQFILRRFGLSPTLNASLAGYERFVLAGVSGVLALIGAAYLFGINSIFEFFSGIPLVETAFLIVVGLVVAPCFWGGEQKAVSLIKRAATWTNFSAWASILALTFLAQLLVLLSFVVGIIALDAQIPIFLALSAAAIISFAASMPITVNGWGVRELTSVVVLGKIGVSSADALTISILIGLLSTIVILVAIPLSFQGLALRKSFDGRDGRGRVSFAHADTIAACILGFTVALTIFFQLHIELSSGPLNINLADPFAILSLAAVGASYVIMRQPMRWQVQGFNCSLLIFTGLLVFAFAIGWSKVGITQWALGGRLLGWLVLMGYLSAGYILVSYGGVKWRRRLVEALTVFASLIILWQVLSRLLFASGFVFGAFLTTNFEGYSGNRNAFAFQLLVITAMLFVLIDNRRIISVPNYTRYIKISILLGVIILGVVLTGSRSGRITEAILLLLVIIWRPSWRGIVFLGISIASVLWCCQLYAIYYVTGASGIDNIFSIQTNITGASSDIERLDIALRALKMWWESPFFGVGLGTFIAKGSELPGGAMVIHSTPLWLLTEFGLLGFLVLGWGCRNLMAFTFKKNLSSASTNRFALALLLVVFGLFGLFHDIFYQRIFWFALGVLIAIPGASVHVGKLFTVSRPK